MAKKLFDQIYHSVKIPWFNKIDNKIYYLTEAEALQWVLSTSGPKICDLIRVPETKAMKVLYGKV